MKAVMLCKPEVLQLADVPVPLPGDGELLVRTGAATICTSDFNDIRENPFGIALPAVIGHEGAGTVAALGPGARGFQVGDRVATHPVHPCGTCYPCRTGNPHLCQNMGHFGINMPGTMAEYYLVRQDRARKIPASMPFTQAALAEPVCVCLEALAQARLRPGNSLLILGDGPFGLIMARLAARIDLAQVLLAGWMDFRLGFAQGVETLNTSQLADPVAELRAFARPAGFDAAILAVASPRALDQGLAALKPKGRLVLFSALTGKTPVDLFSVHVRELEIVGACNDQDRFDAAMEQLADLDLALGELVTHCFPLDRYAEAFALAADGKDRAIKVALTCEDGA